MLSQTEHPPHPAKAKWTRCKSLARYSRRQAGAAFDGPSSFHCLPAGIYLGVGCLSPQTVGILEVLVLLSVVPAPRTAAGAHRASVNTG